MRKQENIQVTHILSILRIFKAFFHRCVNPFPRQGLVFTCLQYKSFENTVGKGDIARNEQYLLSPQCFLPVWKTFCHFHQFERI